MSEPDDTAQAPGPDGSAAGDPSDGVRPLIADVRLLLNEIVTLARSELTFQATRAQVLGAGVRNLALFALFALIFVVFALGGLTVGLLLALTPLVTAWGATAIVVGALLLGAAGCLFAGLGAWRRMKRLLSSEPKP